MKLRRALEVAGARLRTPAGWRAGAREILRLARWIPWESLGERNMQVNVVEGDLLDQKVDVIVNAWNRNLFPWWLLLVQGISGAIKRRGGLDPFRELSRMPLIPLG